MVGGLQPGGSAAGGWLVGYSHGWWDTARWQQVVGWWATAMVGGQQPESTFSTLFFCWWSTTREDIHAVGS